MFEYKSASFYDGFFSSLPDFKLTQKFNLEEKGENKNMYIGKIETVNTVHPMSIDVEIPTTFPHSKMMFWTESFFHYPHLIWDDKHKSSWFCLNTPFAETANEQLNKEIHRLRDWIKRYVRKDLPTVIKNDDVYKALYMANAYSWENIDEMNEYKQDSLLTFIGDFASNISNFKERKGKFNCIKNGSERIFVVENKVGTNYQLPYIIVDKLPNNVNDFLSLKEQYGWDNDTCEFLLPEQLIDYETERWDYLESRKKQDSFSEEEANKIIEKVELKVKENKAAQNIIAPWMAKFQKKELKYKEKEINKLEKNILLKRIESLKEYIKEKHGFNSSSYICDYEKKHKEKDNVEDNVVAPASDEDLARDYIWANEIRNFALGIIQKDNILWYYISTDNNHFSIEIKYYDLQLMVVNICFLDKIRCSVESAQIITSKEYFGRGKFASAWQDKKICVAGVGAIGSMVCESLARSGVSAIGLWDDDTVEPGNICRSAYNVQDIGDSKVNAIMEHIVSINPFVKIETIKKKGKWRSMTDNQFSGPFTYVNGSFYGNVNYASQEDAIKLLEEYDMIFDCTGSNELLHFISYAIPEKEVISMCITNHASNLLLFSSKDGNPFELRKMYLSKIEQDTKNFYIEGTGCYSPTFLASYSDIACLVNLAIKEINANIEQNKVQHSTIWSYTDRGVVADRFKLYGISDSPIRIIIPSETIMDGEEIDYSSSETIGYLFGGYSSDGTMVMVTHIIDADNARSELDKAFNLSNGIIDYLGDYVYSGKEAGTYNPKYLDIIASKASDPSININNPLLTIRNPDGSLSFFLYLAGKLEELIPME